MRFSSLDDWLKWQEGLHPAEIELGLERVSRVFSQLHPTPPAIPVITVAGTNGKGSSIAMLEAIYHAAGYRTGVYTSPHILKYNERIRLNGENVDDERICEAFERIDRARQAFEPEISLTYFEFGTLAALDIFYQQQPDIILLEVGLGGRLDAVNIIDADIALITSIGIDHADWLGNDRESIGREKAGIMRHGKTAIFSGNELPGSIDNYATAIGAPLLLRGRNFDFSLSADGQSWQWQHDEQARTALPLPALRGQHQLENASGVLMAIESLKHKCPVNQRQIREGLLSVDLPGRFQMQVRDSGEASMIYDVAHNSDSIAALGKMLQAQPCAGMTYAILGMMRDKEHARALQAIIPLVDQWLICDLPVPRAMPAKKLANTVEALSDAMVITYPEPAAAIAAVKSMLKAEDRVVIFGSFVTVEFAMRSGI